MTKISAGVEKQESDLVISEKRKAMFPRPTWIPWTEGRNCMRCNCVPTKKYMRFFLYLSFCQWN